MSTTKNPTAYIPTPTSGKDKPPKGWIIALVKDSNRGVPFYCDGSDISYITLRDQFDWWLRPVDLSRMLEDCWNAAVCSTKENSMITGAKWDENVIEFSDHDITQDREKYLSHLLNKEK